MIGFDAAVPGVDQLCEVAGRSPRDPCAHVEGIDYRDQPPGFGKQKRDDYTANDYHAPSDHVKPDWELGGYAEHAKLLMAVGYRVAQADMYPEWKPGNEFRAIREKSLARTR